jgi:hypothetical protein
MRHGAAHDERLDMSLSPLLADVHLTARSGNAKTGDIPVTYRPMTTCEPTCPFLPTGAVGGCYGTGRIFGMAAKYAATVTLDSLRAKLSKRNPAARFMRDRVVGDVINPDGTIAHGYIRAIAIVAREASLIPFGYTHAWRRMTSDDVRTIADTGYVMNASCESREDVRHAVSLGMPTVIASDIVEDGETFTRPDGVTLRVVTCPAQTREDVTCASCGLCARADRRAVVRFNIHGTAKRRAAHAVDIAENGETS